MALTRPSFNQINSTVTSLNDPLTVINKSGTSASQDLGFVFNRDGGATANVAIIWDETNDQFALVNTSDSGATNANVTISSYADVKAGTITAGTMTDGTVSFTSGTITGVDTLRIDQTGTGLRMTNVGAFDNDGSDNFRIFATNDLILSANGQNGTAITIDATNQDVAVSNDLTVTGNITGGNLHADNLTTANAFVVVGSNGHLTQDTTLTVDTSSNYLGINQTSPEVTLHMTGDGAQSTQIRMEQYNDSGDAPDIRSRRGRGTYASQSAVQSGDYIFRLNSEYYNGTGNIVGGSLAFDNTNNAARTQFSVAVDTDGTGADPAGNNGQFKIDGNDSGAITFNNAYKFPTEDGDADQVLSTDGSGTLSFVAPGGSSAYGNTQVGTFLETYNGVLLAVTTANIGQIGYTDNKVTTANIGQIGYTDNKVTTANIGQIGYTDNKVTTANIGQIGFTNETVTQANVGLKGYTDSQLGSKAPLASPSFTTKITTPDIDKSGTNGSGDIGQTDNRFGTIYGLATSAQYADLAEKYTTDQEYSPGTVMSFGGTHEITQCVKSHDRKVAGVISTDPAYMMNSTAEGQYLALQGRVPCKVIGPIEKGELVVTSATPGVAQKLDDAQYQPGCVIGKSLETITDNSIQPIEVVVGRL
jgi:hypothetical protein